MKREAEEEDEVGPSVHTLITAVWAQCLGTWMTEGRKGSNLGPHVFVFAEEKNKDNVHVKMDIVAKISYFNIIIIILCMLM